MNLILLVCMVYFGGFTRCEKGKFPVNMRFDWINSKGYDFETYFMTSWFRANDFCINHGMKLAILETKEERDFVFARIEEIVNLDPELPKDASRTFWLGGHNLASPIGTYRWQSIDKVIDPVLWGPNQTSSLPDQKKCVTIRWSDANFGYELSDEFCHFNCYFVCQVFKSV